MVRGQGEGQPQRHRERQPQTSRFLSGIPVCPHRHLANHIAFVSGPTWDFLQEVCGCIQGSLSGIKESPTTSKAGLKTFCGPMYTLQKSPLPTPRGVPLNGDLSPSRKPTSPSPVSASSSSQGASAQKHPRVGFKRGQQFFKKMCCLKTDLNTRFS